MWVKKMNKLSSLFELLCKTSESHAYDLVDLLYKSGQELPINPDTEEYLKRTLSKPSLAERILLENDIVPYRNPHKNTSTLGQGAYGIVLEGVYKGKPVAVKILSPDDADGAIAQEIIDLNLPPEMKRHFPLYYKIDKSTIDLDASEYK